MNFASISVPPTYSLSSLEFIEKLNDIDRDMNRQVFQGVIHVGQFSYEVTSHNVLKALFEESKTALYNVQNGSTLLTKVGVVAGSPIHW